MRIRALPLDVSGLRRLYHDLYWKPASVTNIVNNIVKIIREKSFLFQVCVSKIAPIDYNNNENVGSFACVSKDVFGQTPKLRNGECLRDRVNPFRVFLTRPISEFSRRVGEVREGGYQR